MTCVHVLIRLFDCLEGGNTSRFKGTKSIDRLIDIAFPVCLAFLLCNMRYHFRPMPNSFERRDILFTPRPLYIHALTNIVSFPEAHAFRSQRFVIHGILLLVAPADITDWLLLHSPTLVPAIPGADSKPFFMSFALSTL